MRRFTFFRAHTHTDTEVCRVPTTIADAMSLVCRELCSHQIKKCLEDEISEDDAGLDENDRVSQEGDG